MVKITIRYWAAAKEAAGMAEESLEAVTLSDALNTAVASRKPDGRLAAVLARSSFLVNADPVGKADKDIAGALRGSGDRGPAAVRAAEDARPHATLGVHSYPRNVMSFTRCQYPWKH